MILKKVIEKCEKILAEVIIFFLKFFCKKYHIKSPRKLNWIWQEDVSPDVVLIDGRFRVCCFLTSLLNAKESATLIFDDYYKNRQHYHFIERFIKPDQRCGRQAFFTVPNKEKLDSALISLAIDKFRFVMD